MKTSLIFVSKQAYAPNFLFDMKKIYAIAFFLLTCPLALRAQIDLTTRFEDTWGTSTVTYEEGIAYLEKLAANFETISLQTYGTTDIGEPLHLAVLSLDQDFDPTSLQEKGKTILMVNNAIHAGEPDGVDASLMLLRDIAQQAKLQTLVENTVIIVIPFYNVGGVLNRGSYSRANQNGPLEYGFRGNARNLDLNRDFIKNDSKNAQTFAEIFHTWQPDLYIENHVTNGADYQYNLTYLATQADKLGGNLGEYMRETLSPDLEAKMKAKNQEIIPYVNVFGQTPDSGYVQFMDSPRYSSGYVALFQTPGIIVETHMLKPFKDRVEATYGFMQSALEHLQEKGQELQQLRARDQAQVAEQKTFPLAWQNDQEKFSEMDFKGYEAELRTSEITGQDRLFYDRKKPYTKKVPFFQYYKPSVSVQKPLAYIIPRAWHRVIDRLERNQVKVEQLSEDQEVTVEAYYIEDYQTSSRPYEGHYPHRNVKLRSETQKMTFRKGDYVVYPNQPVNRYIVETLEPQADDSFFNWNFFDTILQQKEGYSGYVFEEIAQELLEKDAQLRKDFEAQKQNDPEFAQNARQQLDFIYKRSPYYEEAHLRYPIFRMEEAQFLILE